MLAQERRQHEAERDKVLAERASWEAVQGRLDDITGWCDTVAVNLDSLDYAGKRLALEALGIEVRIFSKDHEPRFEIRACIELKNLIVSTTPKYRSMCAPGMLASSRPRSTSG